MYKSLHQYTNGGEVGYKKQNALTNDEIKDITSYSDKTKVLRITNDTDKIYDFKFWVPPGTLSISIYQSCGTSTGSDPLFSFVLSKDKEPTSEPKSATADIKSLSSSGFKLSELSSECFGKDSSGKIIYITDKDLTIETGFWIYAKLLKVGSQEVTNISTENKINNKTYYEWYKVANWGGDGDPVNSSTTASSFKHGNLPPGAYRQIEVTFSPTKAQKYSGDISLSTDKGEFKAAISGEGYGSIDDPGTGTTTTNTTSASVPKASILASEFYNYQDLDDNDLVYGYDFKITDDTSGKKPPDKPIILCILEKSPYWGNPSMEITWKDFLDGSLSGNDDDDDDEEENDGKNPTSYVTIHDPYGKASVNSSGSWAFSVNSKYMETFENFPEYARMFIPPGTKRIHLELLNWTLIRSVSRFNQIPKTDLPTSDVVTQEYKLSDVTSKDCSSAKSDWGGGTDISGSLRIVVDAFSSLSADKSGWLYVHFGGAINKTLKNFIDFTVDVDVDSYNAWYDKYIKNESGWNQKVEGVTTYKPTYTINQNKKTVAGTIYDSGYDSYHQTDFLLAWCSTTVCKNSTPYFICNNPATEMACQEKVKGFQTVFNLNDPRIIYKGQTSGSVPEIFEKTFYQYETVKSHQLRFYVPAGTKKCYLQFLGMTTDAEIATVARFGKPVDCKMPTSYIGLPNDFTGASIPELKEECHFSKNAGGYLLVTNMNYFEELTEGGWLYVIIMNMGGGIVDTASYTLAVNVDHYKSWYNSATFLDNGDPPEYK